MWGALVGVGAVGPARSSSTTEKDDALMRAHHAAGLLIISAIPCAASAGQAAFIALGTFQPPIDPPSSAAFGVSPDGSTVVGASWVAGAIPRADAAAEPHYFPFRWTPGEGLVMLPIPEDALPDAAAVRSANRGVVVVGHNGFTFGPGAYEPRNAAIWLDAGGPAPDALVLNEGYFANDVTPDGAAVVGVSRPNIPFPVPDQAYTWTEAGGLVELGVMPGGSYTWGTAIADDARTVVGFGDFDGVLTAFKWVEPGPVAPLVDNPAGVPSSAHAVSGDGAIVVGHVGEQLVRWTASGLEMLGAPDAGSTTGLLDANADASVIVCTFSFFDERFNTFFRPFIWDGAHGLRELQQVLENDYALDLTGWTLEGVSGISADARTLVGWGRNPSGWSEGWVVVLPPSSCPGDLDGDGDTDSADLNALLGDFSCPGPSCAGDIDGDGDTDSGDLNELLGGFGLPCG